MYSLHKEQRQLTKKILLGLSIGVFSILPVMPAQAMPSQGAYNNTAAATITQADKVMDITGKSDHNIINWQSFSIDKGETVNFNGAKSYLNLVQGADKSIINGAINGTSATVYLINPNGVLFGDTASVNVGTLTVSANAITDDIKNNFSAGKGISEVLGSNTSSSTGDIINRGNLAATTVYLQGQDIILKGIDVAATTNSAASSVTANNITADAAGNIDVGFSTDTTTKKATSTLGSTVIKTAGTATTVNDCQLITTVAELNSSKNQNINGVKNYMLGNDIKLTSSYTPFQLQTNAIFDGAGYSLSDFTYDAGTDTTGAVGVFSKIYKNAYVRHLNIDNVNITNAESLVGGLAGQTSNNAYIDDVHVSGKITGKNSGNTQDIGGIIGKAMATSITDSSSSVEITQTNKVSGGIIGEGDSSTTLSNVSNYGNISSVNGQNIGGIAGQLTGSSITKAYNNGAISGSKNLGGIVGYIKSTGTTIKNAINDEKGIITSNKTSNAQSAGIIGMIDPSATDCSVINVINTSTVAKNTYGIIGGFKAGTLTNAYTTNGGLVNQNASKITNGYTGDNIDLTKAENFTALQNNSDWDIVDGQAPRLTAFLHKQDLTGMNTGTADGTKNTTYHGSANTATVDASAYGLDKLSSTISLTATTNSGNAGTYLGDEISVTATDSNLLGYIFTGTPSITIDPAALKVNISDATMTYGSSTVTYTDGSTNGYSFDADSLKEVESFGDDPTTLTSQMVVSLTNGALATANDQGKVTLDAGTYKITVGSAISQNPNYTVTTGDAGTVTVNKANLTATVNDISTTYGTAFNNADCLTVSGLVNGDTADTLGVAFKNTGEADGTNGRVTQDVGTYTIEADVSASNNYNITLTTGTNTANAYVTKASLNLDNLTVKDSSTSADVTTTYGTAFNTANYTVASTDSKATGFVNGDTIESLGLAYSNTGAADGTNGKYTQDVGTYTITTTLDADKLSNYEITGSGNTVTGTSTVTPATLTLTAAAVTGVPAGWAETTGYTTDTTSGTTSLTPYTGSVSGYVNGDTSSILDGATVTFTSTAPSTAGTYALTGSINGSTSRFGNYYLVQADSNSSALTIVANTASAPLTRTEIPVYSNIITAVSTSGAGSATAVPGEAAPQALTVAVTSDLSATDSTSTEADTTVNAKTSTSSPNVSNSKSILTVVD